MRYTLIRVGVGVGVGAGGQALDTSNILKPALARGEVKVLFLK